jgi:hypothetical protein
MQVTLVRFGHLVGGLYNLAFIYTPLHDWEHGFTIVQWVSTPILVITGIALVRARKRRMAAA